MKAMTHLTSMKDCPQVYRYEVPCRKSFKRFAQKFYAMTFQTNMKDRPLDQQRFTFIHFEGIVNFEPAGIYPRNRWMKR